MGTPKFMINNIIATKFLFWTSHSMLLLKKFIYICHFINMYKQKVWLQKLVDDIIYDRFILLAEKRRSIKSY